MHAIFGRLVHPMIYDLASQYFVSPPQPMIFKLGLNAVQNNAGVHNDNFWVKLSILSCRTYNST